MIRSILESLLFTADEPLEVAHVVAFCKEMAGIETVSTAEVEAAIVALNDAYLTGGHVLRVQAWGGGYRLSTSAEMAPFLKAFYTQHDQRKLSRTLLETISVIAYKQPTTKAEIEYVRGVDADYALRKLLELNLIDVVGRSDAIGRPLLYGTTRAFLDHFGLHTIEDLPSLREIEQLLEDEAFNRERAALLLQSGMAGSLDDSDKTIVDAEESGSESEPEDAGRLEGDTAPSESNHPKKDISLTKDD